MLLCLCGMADEEWRRSIGLESMAKVELRVVGTNAGGLLALWYVCAVICAPEVLMCNGLSGYMARNPC